MNTNRISAAALAASLLLLGGCEHGFNTPADAAEFGEPNRQTMMAQVIDPDPQYDEPVAATSAEHAAQAIERYRTDRVKRPVRTRSTETGGGN